MMRRTRTLFFGVTAGLIVALVTSAASVRLRGREQERDVARREAPLPCRYYRDHGQHVVSFSGCRVNASFNEVAEAVLEHGKRYVNDRPLFGRPAGSLRLVEVRLETCCAYDGGRVAPGRSAEGSVFTAVLILAEEPEGGTWEGDRLDIDAFIRSNVQPVTGPLSPP
jgi:hypothetical protein